MRFAEMAEGDIRLTPAGKRFAELELTNARSFSAITSSLYAPLRAHPPRAR